MITWADKVLCVDSDLAEFESNVHTWVAPGGGAAQYISTAKKVIERRLRSHFREQDKLIGGSEVLDLLADVEPLRQAATYLTLHVLCNDCSTGGDLFERKAEMYYAKYNEEWPYALGRLAMDLDESGAIESTEEYNVRTGVKLGR